MRRRAFWVVVEVEAEERLSSRRFLAVFVVWCSGHVVVYEGEVGPLLATIGDVRLETEYGRTASEGGGSS